MDIVPNDKLKPQSLNKANELLLLSVDIGDIVKFCPKCGNQMSDNAIFCMVCGTKLSDFENMGSNSTNNTLDNSIIQRSNVGQSSIGSIYISTNGMNPHTQMKGVKYPCPKCGFEMNKCHKDKEGFDTIEGVKIPYTITVYGKFCPKCKYKVITSEKPFLKPDIPSTGRVCPKCLGPLGYDDGFLGGLQVLGYNVCKTKYICDSCRKIFSFPEIWDWYYKYPEFRKKFEDKSNEYIIQHELDKTSLRRKGWDLLYDL